MEECVDILMATYNGEKYIEEQINSILKQTYKTWRLLIRDDCSNDNTLKIINYYLNLDKRIELLSDTKGNLGYTKNFEELLKNVKNKYIFLCDQDDIWNEKKIETCVKILQVYDLVHHNAEVFYEKNSIKKELYKIRNYKKGIKNFIFPDYMGCCMAFRKEILEMILPIPKKYPNHDTWIGLLTQINRNIFYSNEKLITYRRHGNNTSPTGEKNNVFILKKIYKRYYYIVYPIMRTIWLFFKRRKDETKV